MALIQRGFQSHDRNHIAKPPFVVNWDSPQARGLRLWIPGHGHTAQDLVGRKPPSINASTLFVANEHGRLVWEAGASDQDLAIFAGTADGDLDFGLANPFTLSVWCDIASSGFGTFVSKCGSTLANRQIQLFTNTGGDTNVRAVIHGTQMDSGISIVDAGPTLVTLTKSGAQATNDVREYIDGDFVLAETAGTDGTNNADFMIGARRNDDSNGGIDFQLTAGSSLWDIRVYDVALNDAEIAHIYEHPSDLALDVGARTNFFVPGAAGPLVGGGRLKTLVGGGLV